MRVEGGVLAILLLMGVVGGTQGAELLPTWGLTTADMAVLELAGDCPVYRLWPGDAGTRADDPLKREDDEITKRDGVLRLHNVTCPTMTLFKPEKPDGRCVLVYPGGGYSILAADHEGVQVAKWLNRQGITAFLVKYRVPKRKGLDKHHVALQDAQRSIRLVRSQAEAFGIDPGQIGTLGFSAGGHLTVLTCMQYDVPAYEPVDVHDEASCRPDFAIPVYPAYLYQDGRLDPLVAGPDRNKTPPMFISVAANDKFLEGAARFVIAANKAKLPIEFHVYEKGGHGQGIRESSYPFSEWTKGCERWLNDLKATRE